tara:strand:- start:1116 stop:1967 length:852 start_codon:yes stop_codon:yes gene_type:complete
MASNTEHFLGYVKERITKNKNVIIVINGATGSGKSYAGIQLGYLISEMFGSNFNIKENVGFEFKDLLKKSMMEKNKAKGTVFLFEEVGAFGGGASSREWQSKANKFFFSFMQTARHRNQILIFTCPNFANLDAGARQLVHVNLNTIGIDFKTNISYLKPYFLQINTRTGKTYFKYMRFKSDNNSFWTRLKDIRLGLPKKEVLDEYEKTKTNFTDNLNKTILNDGVESVKPKDKKQIDRKTYFKLKKFVGSKQASELMKMSESSRKRLNKEEDEFNKKDIGGNL